MRKCFRYAFPWNYALTEGNWIFGLWDWRHHKGFPEWGIRILGLEFWIEYWEK